MDLSYRNELRVATTEFDEPGFWHTVRLRGGQASRVRDPLASDVAFVTVVSAAHPAVVAALKRMQERADEDMADARTLEAHGEQEALSDPRRPLQPYRDQMTVYAEGGQRALQPARSYQVGLGSFVLLQGHSSSDMDTHVAVATVRSPANEEDDHRAQLLHIFHSARDEDRNPSFSMEVEASEALILGDCVDCTLNGERCEARGDPSPAPFGDLAGSAAAIDILLRIVKLMRTAVASLQDSLREQRAGLVGRGVQPSKVDAHAVKVDLEGVATAVEAAAMLVENARKTGREADYMDKQAVLQKLVGRLDRLSSELAGPEPGDEDYNSDDGMTTDLGSVAGFSNAARLRLGRIIGKATKAYNKAAARQFPAPAAPIDMVQSESDADAEAV